MAPPYDQMILFGDSITEFSEIRERDGFGPALRNAYIRRLDVVNRGFSGYNSGQGYVALPKFFPTKEQATVRFLIIFFGANDAVLPDVGRQYVPLETYKQHLKDIINHPKVKEHNPKVILITPGPIEEYATHIHDLERGFKQVRRTAANAKIYSEATKDVGKELNVPVVDIWTSMMLKTGWKEGDKEPYPGSCKLARNTVLDELLLDGLHFAPLGYQLLYEEIMKTIEKNWPEEMPEKLSPVFPLWPVAPTVD